MHDLFSKEPLSSFSMSVEGLKWPFELGSRKNHGAATWTNF